MKVVDPHFHLWDLDFLSYPWLTTGPSIGVFGDNTPIRKAHTLADYLASAGSIEVVKTVHVEAAVEAGNDVAETVWLDDIARNEGQPNGIVGFCDLSSDDVEAKLALQCLSGRMRGIRQILNTHDDPLLNFASQEYMENPSWNAGFELLAERNLSFDLQIYPRQMSTASALAKRNPHTAIVLNHTGMPTSFDQCGFNEWQQGMSKLAICENVSVKISGLGMMFHNWTVEAIRPFVLETINLFGVDRCMFASNFPVDGMYSTFEFLWLAYADIVSDQSMSMSDKLFHQTAEKIYRI
ncbi:amidohydrolase family protein [Pacificibacter marinus]|uniref:amidohydrolase family protein n=1 Tax=Pacificibacter marinus TaxID=658057 RepID=UPI001C06D3BE|nr:amidohydrolase family protein [Pacificibacter marinus]MBU2868418.1 amidohydrolase family protein [Pacificibacter marinus]